MRTTSSTCPIYAQDSEYIGRGLHTSKPSLTSAQSRRSSIALSQSVLVKANISRHSDQSSPHRPVLGFLFTLSCLNMASSRKCGASSLAPLYWNGTVGRVHARLLLMRDGDLRGIRVSRVAGLFFNSPCDRTPETRKSVQCNGVYKSATWISSLHSSAGLNGPSRHYPRPAD